MEKHIVMTGGPVDGYKFYGPFDDVDEAIEWAEADRLQDSWWIVPLEAPGVQRVVDAAQEKGS